MTIETTRRTMNRIFRTWLLCQYTVILLTPSITSEKLCSSSSNTNYCKCEPGSSGAYEFIIECKLPSDVTNSKIKVKMTLGKVNQEVEIIEIDCLHYKDTNYIGLIRSLSDRMTANVHHFTISYCPVPNTTYAEIFNVFNAAHVTNLELKSTKMTHTLRKFHFEGLSGLKELNLDQNFEQLPENVFENIPNLKNLHIRYNSALKSLPKRIFDPLQQLISLDIHDNSLSNFDENIFQSTRKLKTLSLNNNKLFSLPGSIFRNLTELTELYLLGNKMQTLKDGTFDDLEQLQFLHLAKNQLLEVPEKPFKYNSKLENIRMNQAFHENFTGLPSEFFAGLKMLKSLDLNNNHLSNLPVELFRHLTGLQTLSLSSNKLSQLDDKLFDDLGNLETLSLNGNRLTSFTTAHVQYLRNLTELNLSKNKLTMESNPTSKYSSIDSCCKQLDVLSLSDNLVTRVFSDWQSREVFPALRVLNLSKNRISKLTLEDFEFRVNKNMTVDFTNNNITNITMKIPDWRYFNPTASITFKIGENPLNCDCNALSLAQYLHLQRDSKKTKPIRIEADNLICDTPYRLKKEQINNLIGSLTEFKCSILEGCPAGCNCYIRPHDTAIEVNCTSKHQTEFPRSLPKVPWGYGVELIYTNNSVMSTRGLKNLTKYYTNITTIALSYNKLEQFDLDELPKELKVLELHNNKLKYLNGTIFGRGKRNDITHITFHKNPWECNCSLIDLWDFINQTRLQTNLPIPDYLEIQCNDGRPFSHLTAEDFCNNTHTIILICVSFAIIGLLSGIIIALYSMYKWEIKVWMFAHKLCLWLVSEEELDKDKLYDIFVSFSHLDQDFVDTQLIPQLENNDDYNYKLCVHYRDFKVGEFIPSQIINSVENSRRTIIVLSSNFLKSVWGRMEFRTAHSKAIKEGCARVIIVLLEDVSMEKLDPELKTYITMNTYVKWGDRLFWDKLKYALPHPQRVPKKLYQPVAQPAVSLKQFNEAEKIVQCSLDRIIQ